MLHGGSMRHLKHQEMNSEKKVKSLYSRLRNICDLTFSHINMTFWEEL